MTSAEESQAIDERYFVDEDTFNCAFCKRRNVPYAITTYRTFDWTITKQAQLFIVKCSACDRRSLHITFVYDLVENNGVYGKIVLEDPEEGEEMALIDDLLIYSQPTSFFTLDSSIPRVVREHIMDAENSVQMNLLTGASASLRKAIYTLLKAEGSLVANEATSRTDYKESISVLASKFSFVDESLFASLGSVQGLTSDNVHEDSWESWDRKSIRFLIELTKDILTEMYVIPAKRKIRLARLAELKSSTNESKKLPKAPKN